MQGYSRWLNGSIKVGIVLALAVTLYQEVGPKAGVAPVWAAFQEGIQGKLWPLILVVLVLMPVNWALEALKWRIFTKAFYPMPFRQSLEAVLAGVTLSLITPQRLGDYGGRLLRVPSRYNWQTVTATVVSNLCQLVVLLSAGGLGLYYFSARYWPAVWKIALEWLPLIFGLPLLLFASMLYLRPLSRSLLKYAAGQRFKRFFGQLRSYSRRKLIAGVSLAALRYGVYTSQYYLLLLFFGIAPPAQAAFAGITTIFFLQSSVPLPPLLGLLARGEIALLVWGVFDANEFSILAATLSLFIINLIIPALLGLVIVVKTNILKSFRYEKNCDQNGPVDDGREYSDGF